jgi:mannose-6-phosphate isomerase class I
MTKSSYDKFPAITVPGGENAAWRGWSNIIDRWRTDCEQRARPVIAIECYPGVLHGEIAEAIKVCWPQARLTDMDQALLPEVKIAELIAPFTGGNDPIFGYLCNLTLDRFFRPDALKAFGASARATTAPLILLGPGAFLAAPPGALLVYADMPRWEIQQRQRQNKISNLGSSDRTAKASLQYKRAFFVDWRVADRLKRVTMETWDYLLDTTVAGDPKLVQGSQFRRALAHAAARPFRVVPFFDPGPWGGQWMKEICDLDRSQLNFAWCFDCVPEENSLRFRFGGVEIEVPAIDLVFAQPLALLGQPVYGRFGAEFPIRFDFLDTMGGGNLSLQVHPLTHYMQENFGLHYTQDESYYLLDAKPDAQVYLGCKTGIRRPEFEAALKAAERGEAPFRDQDFVGRFPAKAHDHFLIPAGTLHCSGAGAMVLEISATPYIFTFKLWDWNRLGLDGKPRPINIARGMENVCWDRDEGYVARHLINRITPLGDGDGWREERTGLHEVEFIETRRHWFKKLVHHDTGGSEKGGVQVLNLVAGAEAIVESPEGAFNPFVVHYAETFIVPAGVGRYTIRPHGPGEGQECATVKAFVRTNP